MDITMKSKASSVTASRGTRLDIKLWRIILFFSFFALSSITNWQNKYINVLSHYPTPVALCFSDSKKGPRRPDSLGAVYQWKSNIVHKQGSGNQYFITKLLVRMKKNSWRFLLFFWQSSRPGLLEVQCQGCCGMQRWPQGGQPGTGELWGLRHWSCNQKQQQ